MKKFKKSFRLSGEELTAIEALKGNSPDMADGLRKAVKWAFLFRDLRAEFIARLKAYDITGEDLTDLGAVKKAAKYDALSDLYNESRRLRQKDLRGLIESHKNKYSQNENRINSA